MSIPIPPDLARGRVTWLVGRDNGTDLPGARGTVRFEATAVAVTYSTATVLPSPEETPVVNGVMTPVDLLVNDPEVWNWTVTPRVGVKWEPFNVDVDGAVDLATAAQMPGKGPVRAVKGETGPGIVDADYDGGDVTFIVADGTRLPPITMPEGPPGPVNSLTVGLVSTGAPGDVAQAWISGESPDQFLNLEIPQGEKPVTVWQGSTLVVDGTAGPDLRGPQGPPGPAAFIITEPDAGVYRIEADNG